MKKTTAALLCALIAIASVFCFAACGKPADAETLRFAMPEGTPALAAARLFTDNPSIGGHKMEYAVVKPGLIATETEKADVVIMPVNAGAFRIRQGADMRMVSVAVGGSLYVVGKSDRPKELQIEDLKGKRVACIGQKGVPGLVFRFVMREKGVSLVADENKYGENNVLVTYVADGQAAGSLLNGGKADYAVVGEPAATAFGIKFGCKARLDVQKAYREITGADSYPQAGLFVRTALVKDGKFMDGLFAALAASREWVSSNPKDVTDFMQKHAYASAAFPPPSIENCDVRAVPLTDADRRNIVDFLNDIMPRESGSAWTGDGLFA